MADYYLDGKLQQDVVDATEDTLTILEHDWRKPGEVILDEDGVPSTLVLRGKV